MQAVKNMLTSDSIKGPYMKPFLILLFPFVLFGCGAEPGPATDDALSATPPEPAPAAQEADLNSYLNGTPHEPILLIQITSVWFGVLSREKM